MSDGKVPDNQTSIPGVQSLRLDRRRLIILGILGVLTVTLLFVLGDTRSTLTALTRVNWTLVGVAILVHYSGFAVRGHRWQILLAALGHRTGYLYTTGVLFSGWFVSALLPARAGDIFRVALLRLPPPSQPAVPVADSISSIVLERALDIVAILCLSIGFGLVVLGAQLPPWLLTAYVLVVVVLGVFVLALLLVPALLDWLRHWSSHRLWQIGLDFAGQMVTSLRRLPHHPLAAAIAFLESIYIWICDAFVLWLVVWSLGVLLPFSGAAFVALTVDVFAAVPLTPGGIGQVESAYAALLTLLPFQLNSIPAVILVTRAISYWSFLLVSGFITFAAGFGRLLNAEKTGSLPASTPEYPTAAKAVPEK